jgi:hydroxylamine reductase (hybrid-cluster protein)
MQVRSLCNAAATGDMEQIGRLLNSGLCVDSTDANKR